MHQAPSPKTVTEPTEQDMKQHYDHEDFEDNLELN